VHSEKGPGSRAAERPARVIAACHAGLVASVERGKRATHCPKVALVWRRHRCRRASNARNMKFGGSISEQLPDRRTTRAVANREGAGPTTHGFALHESQSRWAGNI